jgi:hypothetical protein
VGVGEWFSAFCGELSIGTALRESFASRTGRIVGQLNSDFRGIDSKIANRFYVGSYGRNTAIPTVSDVDVLYELPVALYAKYDAYETNGQSSLLSAVRASMRKTYSSSEISGDGQVVVVSFTDNVRFEVLPAFPNHGGYYTFPDSNNGGSWRTCKPKQEMSAFSARDANSNQNLIRLGRMIRAWRDHTNAPMSGMLIDTLAYQFMETWEYRQKSHLYYDWMTRDFFTFLANQDNKQQYWLAPGSGSYVYRSGHFEYKARQAELRAREAIEYQTNQNDWSAKQKYREIYGTNFPK